MKVVCKTIQISFKEDFIKFLVRNNAFEKYCYEINRNYKTPEAFAKNILWRDCKFWISGVFPWLTASDGETFWADISTEWKKFIEQDLPVTFILQEDEDKLIRICNDVLLLIDLQGKYYSVKDNSWNRVSSPMYDYQDRWKSYSEAGKALAGKKYLILSNKPVTKIIDDNIYLNPIPRQFIKVWIPEYECVQWVLYQGYKNVTEK